MKKSQQPQIIPRGQDLLNGILNQKDLSKFLTKAKSHDEIKIVYFGTPEFSAYILERLIKFSLSKSHYDPRSLNILLAVKAVVTGVDKSPVALVAQKYNIPVLKPIELNDDFIKNHISFLESDLFIVASFGQILPKILLDIPKLGAINIHGSILPKYRGASPIQTAILNGDKETGITIIKMDEKLDHGPILSTKIISISEQDTFESLSNKMMQLGSKLLLETLPKFVGGRIFPKPQNHTKATFCGRLTKNSGYFDIQNPPSPELLDRMIRAYHPWPGVWTRWSPSAPPSPKELQLRRPSKATGDKQAKIVKFLPGGLLQMEGKKAIPLQDFLNGYPDFPLKTLP